MTSPGMLPFEVFYTGIRSSYYLVSRHPIDLKDPINSIFDPFDFLSWMSVVSILILLTIGLLLSAKFFQKHNPNKVTPNLSYGLYFLRIIFGLTEPEDINVFKPLAAFSSGAFVE